MDNRVVDQVIIIKNQQFPGGRFCQIVEQLGHQKLPGRKGRGLQLGHQGAADLWVDPLIGRDQIAQEAGGVVITFVEGKPGCRKGQWVVGDSQTLLQPVGDQRGLAIAGHRRYKGQAAGQAAIQHC